MIDKEKEDFSRKPVSMFKFGLAVPSYPPNYYYVSPYCFFVTICFKSIGHVIVGFIYIFNVAFIYQWFKNGNIPDRNNFLIRYNYY